MRGRSLGGRRGKNKLAVLGMSIIHITVNNKEKGISQHQEKVLQSIGNIIRLPSISLLY
jgi:hypothetical protein